MTAKKYLTEKAPLADVLDVARTALKGIEEDVADVAEELRHFTITKGLKRFPNGPDRRAAAVAGRVRHAIANLTLAIETADKVGKFLGAEATATEVPKGWAILIHHGYTHVTVGEAGGLVATVANRVNELMLHVPERACEEFYFARAWLDVVHKAADLLGTATVDDAKVYIDGCHDRDAHCTVNPDDDTCFICNTGHPDPCPDCGGRAFHTTADCPGNE